METTERRAVIERAEALIQQFGQRDSAAAIMRSVRSGDFEAVAPGAFTEDYPAPVVANRIDTMARDMAATLTPLPTFTCNPTNGMQDKAKEFASKRTKILQSYVECSNLQAQMPDAADNFNTYGLLGFHVEPDYKYKVPKIRQVDGSALYPVWDQDLKTVECAQVVHVSIFTLEAYWPEKAAAIRENYRSAGAEKRLKVVRYENADIRLAYLPGANNMVLYYDKNPMGRCTFVAVPRPSGGGHWSAVPRGAYDDLIFPQIAAHEFRMLALDGVAKAVQAPLAVPMDVTDVPFGPDAVIHTSTPEKIRRVGTEVPQAAFSASELLDRDIQVGGMSPGSRSGSVNASVITGRGIDALGEGYSSQVEMAQRRVGWGLKQAASLCFEMDEKLWPNLEKEARGSATEAPFSIKYKPSRDIAGDYSVDVDYGFLLGLDPNRALVFILQAQAAGLISRDTSTRNLPIPLNLAEENSKIELEQMRGALIQAFAATSQAIPELVTQGQDPMPLIGNFVKVIQGLKKNLSIEDAAAKAFAPDKKEQAAAQQPSPEEMMAQQGMPGQPQPGGEQLPPGLQGQMQKGIATEGPAGRPDLAMMFSGLTAGGQPNLGATVSRMAPAR